MAKFDQLTAHMAPLLVDNIDTDQIIPARFLKVIDKEGLGKQLFCDWRYQSDGAPNPDFVLNREPFDTARILLTGDNFGCGSSREHAPWALHGFGIRAVISTSFADIFRNNALKNGILPVIVEPALHQQLIDANRRDPLAQVKIDLRTSTLTAPDGTQAEFPIDDFSKHCLLNGIDQLGYIQGFEEQIKQYEAAHG